MGYKVQRIGKRWCVVALEGHRDWKVISLHAHRVEALRTCRFFNAETVVQ